MTIYNIKITARAILYFFCLSFFFLSHPDSHAQVMFVGTKMISVKGGIPLRSPFYTKGSWRTGVEYSEFMKGGNYWSVGLDTEVNNIPKKDFVIPELAATVTGNYNLFLFGDVFRQFNLYGSAGLSLGYGLLNNGKEKLKDGDILAKNQSFICGGKMGIHTDIYLPVNLTLFLGTGTYLLWGTLSRNVFRPYIEGGIKIPLY